MDIHVVALSSLNSWAQFFTVFFIFLFVLFLAWISTRWIGKLQQGTMHNRNIKIIETFRIGPNKCIQIIKVGEKYVAIAVSKDTVTHICDLDQDEISEENPMGNQLMGLIPENFEEILKNVKHRMTKK